MDKLRLAPKAACAMRISDTFFTFFHHFSCNQVRGQSPRNSQLSSSSTTLPLVPCGFPARHLFQLLAPNAPKSLSSWHLCVDRNKLRPPGLLWVPYFPGTPQLRAEGGRALPEGRGPQPLPQSQGFKSTTAITTGLGLGAPASRLSSSS